MKTFTYTSISVLFILLCISCVAYLQTAPHKRSFKQRLESFPATGLPLTTDAVLYWDDHLIPFIEAKTDEDCAFLMGMVHAHLRLGQMTLFLRAAQGRLAESAGPFALSIDWTLRIVNIGAAKDSIEQILPGATKSWLQHYARGINFYQEHMTDPPEEFRLLGLRPEPWKVADVLLLGRLMSVDVNWMNWFQWIRLRDKPYWKSLWKRITDAGTGSTSSFGKENPLLNTFFSSGIRSGSNAIAVSGSLSADSHSILINDTHLGLQLPNTWVIMGYQCPSYHVAGLMFPGIPIVLVGRNDAIAWGGTNMRSASSDLYSLTPEQAKKCTTRREKIRVRWWPDKKVAIRTSAFGPIISDSPLFTAARGQTLALRWVGFQASDEMTALLKVNQAHSWAEFHAAFETYGVSGQNFLYADTAGHIGMVPAVKIPVRDSGVPDDFVFDAGDPSCQWNGYLKATEIPSVFDPQQDFIASANNRPLICQPPLGYFFSANDRIDRMTDLMRSDTKIDLHHLRLIQQDVYAPSAVRVRDCLLDKINSILPAVPFTEKEFELLDTLRLWNGCYTPQSRGALAFQLIMYYFIQRYYGQVYDDAVVKMLLSSEHANTYVQLDLNSGDTSLVSACLIRAVQKASKRSAHFTAWGDIHRLQLKHILGNIPLLGARYHFGDFPARGSYNTIQKTAHQISDKKHGSFYGANARFITRMIDPDENYFVLLGGQDGSAGSQNFIDQVPLWLEGKYIRIPLSKEAISAAFPHRMRLMPNR